MKNFSLSTFPLYRWRYWLTYAAVALVFVTLLFLAVVYIPGGTTTQELKEAVVSSRLDSTDLTPSVVTDLPFHFLQKLSFIAFGVSLTSIKLPSLLLGVLMALAFSVLLHRWFRPNVAALTTILVVSTGLFVFLSQNGTPTILYVLWPTLLLLFATLIAQGARQRVLWQILFAFTVAASLYSPASIYIIIALIITSLVHPKLRLTLKRASPRLLLLPLLLLVVLLLPLALAIATTPQLGLTLLGIPSSMPNFIGNLTTLYHQYLGFLEPNSGQLMTPILGLGSLSLVAVGAYHLLKRSRYTVRNYLIVLWILLLLPVIIVNPTFSPVMLVPLFLLMATGIDTLIHRWYILFPKNPYARFAGLLPLVLLITTLTSAGVERFVYGYHYGPETSTYFSRDVRILERTVRSTDGRFALVTTPEEKEFYELFAHENTAAQDRVVEVRTSPAAATQNAIYTHDAKESLRPSGLPITIATSTRQTDSDRFYLYKPDEK